MNGHTKRITDLDALVELTLHMLERARAGEWDGMVELERERFSFLQLALDPPIDAKEAAHVAPRLAQILEVDKEIAALAAAARDESAAQLRGLRQGQRAHSAYSSNEAP